LSFQPARSAQFSPGVDRVDIDDVLPADLTSFRSLRAMDSITFGRVDDEEAEALQDAVLRANEASIRHGIPSSTRYPDAHLSQHASISSRLTPDYDLDVAPVLGACASGKRLSHEMALEAGVVAQISKREPQAVETFGDWDYVTHQVLASPFKPLKWADRMDLFGYAHIPGYRTITRYLVAELKKGDAIPDDVDQVMKYVDWVKDVYANSDYGMIHAFLVAARFPTQTRDRHKRGHERNYTIGRRPARLETWRSLRLVTYQWQDGQLRFTDVKP
ncbi:MAG: hypothetical protein WEE66_12005, partial [Actinomycetota bacterium]